MHSISDGSVHFYSKTEKLSKSNEASSNDDTQSNLEKNIKSEERLITLRYASELTTHNAKNSPSPEVKQKVSTSSPSVDIELGEIERALTDTRKSIDAKFFRSLANSSSPFFKPARPPGLTSPDENEISDENEATFSNLERDSLNYGTTSSEFEHEFVPINATSKNWITTTKSNNLTSQEKSSDESKDEIYPPQPPPKTYQKITEKSIDIRLSPGKRPFSEYGRDLKSPPVPPKPISKVIQSNYTEKKYYMDAKTHIETSLAIENDPVKRIIAKSIESGCNTSKVCTVTEPMLYISSSSVTSTRSSAICNQVFVSSCSQGGAFVVSSLKEGVVTVTASNIVCHKKTDSYVSSVTSLDDHGSFSDSSLRSQETLTSEKDSDPQRGNLVRTKVRDATEIINERNKYKGTSRVRESIKNFSVDECISSTDKKSQQTQLTSRFDSDTHTTTTSMYCKVNNLEKVTLDVTASNNCDVKKSTTQNSSKVGKTYEISRTDKGDSLSKEVKSDDKTAKFDESLNETFAKLDAAFGFRRQNGSSSRVETPREEKRKKKSKSSRRRSRNFEPPSSDSSEDIDVDVKRRSRNLRRNNLDDVPSCKSIKSEAEESLEAAISDFRISLSDMQDDCKRDLTTKANGLRNSHRDNLTSNSSLPCDNNDANSNTPNRQQPQKLTYVKTIPVNTVQASSIKRPVSDGTAVLNMSPNTMSSENFDEVKGRGRSRSEAKISMRPRPCVSPTPKSLPNEIENNNLSRNDFRNNDHQNLQSSRESGVNGSKIETVEETTIVESVILEDEMFPSTVSFLPISPTRGGIQTLPERSEKKRRATCNDQLGKGNGMYVKMTCHFVYSGIKKTFYVYEMAQ